MIKFSYQGVRKVKKVSRGGMRVHCSHRLLWIILIVVMLVACDESSPPSSPQPLTATGNTLTLYYPIEENFASFIFDQFKQETGITVNLQNYTTSAEAVNNIRSGIGYDLVVLDNQSIFAMIQENRLVPINHANVTNFKNISPNFRDLAYDPQNSYSIPSSWGTIGIGVRTDLVTQPITNWSDLWALPQLGIFDNDGNGRSILAIALKMLGYSANSENPAEIEAALEKLQSLRPNAQFLSNVAAVENGLVTGQIPVVVAASHLIAQAQQKNGAIQHILPGEGTILWGDNFAILAASSQQVSAEKLLDYLLRPEVSAQLITLNHLANANETAYPFVEQSILSNEVGFPPSASLQRSEPLQPLSQNGVQLYQDVWNRFLGNR